MIYGQLFIAFLQIGALSFGGGYAAMPLIRAQTVERYGWLSPEGFTDLVTIAEMTPGPIAVNAATFVGNQLAGISGAAVATLGVILVPCLFATALAWLYRRYRKLSLMQGVLQTLRPAVVALIFAAGLNILIPTLFRSGIVSFAAGNPDIRGAILFSAAFALMRTKKLRHKPILIMAGCGLAELAAQLLLQ